MREGRGGRASLQHDSLRDSSSRYASFDSMEGLAAIEPSAPSRILSALPHAQFIHAVYPGFLAAATIALASSWLAQHYTAPVMLFALLFGMAFHFLYEEGRCVAGIEFASRAVLRLGVSLLGLRITLAQIASLGIGPVAMVIVGVATTILLGVVLARRLGLARAFGALSGGAVAICGASAALAVASVLPRHPNSERDTILTVVAVTALSTLAMILYPIFVVAIGLDHVKAGIFLGGTIHDVAQVVGAGYSVSQETGDIATYVKLLRVAMLLPAVLAISVALHRAKGQRAAAPALPGFLVAFAVLVLLNSFDLVPKAATDLANDLSRWCLVAAISALGMKTSFKELFAVGWRPIVLMIIETAWIGAVVLACVKVAM